MSWIASELPDLPTLPISSITQSRQNQVAIHSFSGEHEQRIDYAGPKLHQLVMACNIMTESEAQSFESFWIGRKGSLRPFRYIWQGNSRYWRFDGNYSLDWKPPMLAALSFSIREMHPSEIVL